MKRVIFIATAVIMVVSLVALWLNQRAARHQTLTVGDATVQVELADTASLRERGLGGRSSLDQAAGMLFIFRAPGRYGFWMKDMKFPIDIIWIADGRIVDIAPEVQPDLPLQTYFPRASALWVLEVNGGFAALHHLKIGDAVTYKK